jgi:hypothetical protein
MLFTSPLQRTPSLTLPRKRERGQTESAAAVARVSFAGGSNPNISTRLNALPLPLAGEGWGGGEVSSQHRSRVQVLNISGTFT